MIDWHKQWEMHAHHFCDGLARIPLPNRSREILLKPGPGFGDLSHPTTRLMMEMLQKEKNASHVLDVGCGSGILSFVAKAYGAESVYGIDIDSFAIEHAKENNLLNEMTIHFLEVSSYLSLKQVPELLLINMISSEQKQAWDSLKILHQKHFKIIASGVLKTEKENYLKECALRNWHLLEQHEQEGWLGFIFMVNSESKLL